MKHILSLLLLVACGQKKPEPKIDHFAENRKNLEEIERLQKWKDTANYYSEKINTFKALTREADLAYTKTGEPYFKQRVKMHLDSVHKYWEAWQRFDKKQ